MKHQDNLTYGHIYGFWLKTCEELPSEIDPIEVHIHPSRDFKPFTRDDLWRITNNSQHNEHKIRI